ncbi:MarR family winged helix-turn-helix transcriptional regulator [Rhizohabitans arisaemae]|uniref:MarR family winged helix-turn-helix transcriptional regulator n=1 Tax=Rhizohabitans arisaemae TaxID=2720610 RepID=UPI0024B0A685|nr:MarR family transcriptional regulator [Rhizohabitans arisaemae]
MSTQRARVVSALYDEKRLAAGRAVQFHAAVAARAGLNVTDVNCIALLDKEGPMTAGELARWMGLSRGGAVTAVIDRLEKAGFVRRRRDAADRRQVIVELVRDGAYTGFQKTFDDFGAAYTALIEEYTDEELAVLLDFARRANEIVHRTALEIGRP